MIHSKQTQTATKILLRR